MNIEEYERMYDLEGTYWWFQGRLAMIRAILEHYLPEPPLPGRVLDVGCGTGLMLKTVADWQPIGLDLSRLALGFCRERKARRLLLSDVIHLPLESDSLDLVLALDLMEHVERDDLLIREFNRVLRPGGFLMATVPAHPHLWSDHDIALHHYRRYTAEAFRDLLGQGRFSPIKFSYGIFFVHPVIVLFRKMQRWWQQSASAPRDRARTHLIPLPRQINDFLIRLLHVEAWMLKHWDLPQGTSLVTLSQKTVSLD